MKIDCSNLSIFVACFSLLFYQSVGEKFNFEVGKRISERLHEFLEVPIQTNKIMSNFLEHGLFQNDLHASNRDFFLTLVDSIQGNAAYYGMENGLFTGYIFDILNRRDGMYREPGNSGYSIKEKSSEMAIHFQTCLTKSGKTTECRMTAGSSYIKDDCPGGDNCPLLPCPGEKLRCGEMKKKEDQISCIQNMTLCRTYTIETANENDEIGYIPGINFCLDNLGRFSSEASNCYFTDGITRVKDRIIPGPYEYCGIKGELCDNTFIGGFKSMNYDPRFRPWYIQTKRKLVPNWTPPYTFIHSNEFGITYNYPIYLKNKNGQRIFSGIFAVDYLLNDLHSFLIEAYGHTGTAVAIFEEEEPHYIIATSTGTSLSKKVLVGNETEPCPSDAKFNTLCKLVRNKMADISGQEMDSLLVKSYQQHNMANYPNKLLPVKESDDIDSSIYLSQAKNFILSGNDLKWRIIISSPISRSKSDAITNNTEAPLLAVSFISGFGFLLCFMFFIFFYSKRKEKIIIQKDWRFTSAFLLGCAFVNVSSLTLIGRNTQSTCLVRMWSFHIAFVTALSPLFVKVWRLKKLLEHSTAFKSIAITNAQAVLFTIPMIFSQVLILLVFTFVDPSKPTESVEYISKGEVSHRIYCKANSSAFLIVELIFEASIIFAGCVLAWKCRNLDPRYGESKQLVFAMYNIALVGVIIVAFVRLTELKRNDKKIIQTIGVFWGTVFSSAAFVLPQMIQITNNASKNKVCNEEVCDKQEVANDATEATTPVLSSTEQGKYTMDKYKLAYPEIHQFE